MLKMASESFIHALLSFLGLFFFKISGSVPQNLGNPNAGLKYHCEAFKVFKTPLSDGSMSVGNIESAVSINKTMIA